MLDVSAVALTSFSLAIPTYLVRPNVTKTAGRSVAGTAKPSPTVAQPFAICRTVCVALANNICGFASLGGRKEGSVSVVPQRFIQPFRRTGRPLKSKRERIDKMCWKGVAKRNSPDSEKGIAFRKLIFKRFGKKHSADQQISFNPLFALKTLKLKITPLSQRASSCGFRCVKESNWKFWYFLLSIVLLSVTGNGSHIATELLTPSPTRAGPVFCDGITESNKFIIIDKLFIISFLTLRFMFCVVCGSRSRWGFESALVSLCWMDSFSFAIEGPSK